MSDQPTIIPFPLAPHEVRPLADDMMAAPRSKGQIRYPAQQDEDDPIAMDAERLGVGRDHE